MDNRQVTDERFYDLLGRYVEASYPNTDTNVLQALLNSHSNYVKIDQSPQDGVSEEDFSQFLGMKIV